MLIICARLLKHVWVYLHVYVYSAPPRLHVTTHKFKRREEDEGEGEKKGGIILFFFFKAAHYLTVSGCMAPSQNIMMRINSPGTTSFCWRPSQGSASALPPQTLSLFFSFPLFSLHHWHIGVCAMSSVDGELGSSGCISPIIRAAAFSSLTPFPLSLFTLPPFLSVHLLKFPLFQDLFFSPLLLLYSSLSPLHLHAPSLPPSSPPAATAWPRLWFKHDGHPFEARGHHHHHHHHRRRPVSSAASSASDQFN